MPFSRSLGNRKPFGYFSWFLIVLTSSKFIVFKKISEFFDFTVFVFFCLIITKPFYGLVHIFSGDF